MKRPTLILISALLSWGISQPVLATDLPAARPADLIELRLGQSIALEPGAIEIRFEAVLEDSRCPASVDCIWNGPLRVLLSAQRVGGEREQWILDTGPSGPQPLAGDRSLYLFDLEPRPRPNRVVAPDEYVVFLRITGSPAAGAGTAHEPQQPAD